MSKTITIEPVTRIEGHAKISIFLDEQGQVSDTRFHVTEFRGFEKFCVGRSFWEMPGITARICGICPVSHLLASSKAGDRILGVHTPEPAIALRRLMNYAQLVQSHALSFFLLSGPDLLLGMDAPAEERNMMGLVAKHPELAKAGIAMRSFGQKLIQALGDRSVHPAWSVPGGVRKTLSKEDRAHFLGLLPAMYTTIEKALDLMKDTLDQYGDEINNYGDFPSYYMGMVAEDGSLEHYSGSLRMIDATGRIVENAIVPERYYDYLVEAEQPWSYLKFPYYKPAGEEQGMYRVGPLARLNVCDFIGTPKADRELRQFRHYGKNGEPVSGSFYYHYARLIEILTSLEHIESLLQQKLIDDPHIRSKAGVNANVGVGISEAPRGTLIHHYEVDDSGLLTKVNLIIATGQNNLAMNKTVKQLAQAYVSADKLQQGLLNRVEHGIRAYDPCLSCSTHEAGRMPLDVKLYSASGELLDQVSRD